MFSNGALTPVRVSLMISPGRSAYEHPPKLSLETNSKLQAQYRLTNKSFNVLIALLKAA
jgi:hypothetical protein